MKRFLKSFCSFGLVLLLMLSLSITSFADINDLMIGSGSNALMTMELDDSDYSIAPFSSIINISNTIDYSNAYLWLLLVNNETGMTVYPEGVFDNNGESVYQVPQGHTLIGYGINMTRGSLPRAGKYRFQCDVSSAFSLEYSTFIQQSVRKEANVSNLNQVKYIDGYVTTNSGDWYSDYVLDIGNISNLIIQARCEDVPAGEFIDIKVKVNFTASTADADMSTVGIGSGQEDYENDVSSSLSDISSSVDTMTDEISGVTEAIQNLQGAMEPHYSNVLTQLHHITEQLHAFYDQVYNNIHLVELDILEGILAAIENMDLEVNVELGGLKQTIERVSSEIQANDNKLAAEQIANDEANTEEIKDAVEEHGNFIIDGLKGLFIPSDEFFKSYFDDLYEYFSDRFGFLSFPFDLLARFVDLVVNSSDVDCVLTLPSFEIMGEQLLYENSFNLTEFLEQNFGFLLSAIRMGTSIILIMSFVQLCGDKWKEVMNR